MKLTKKEKRRISTLSFIIGGILSIFGIFTMFLIRYIVWASSASLQLSDAVFIIGFILMIAGIGIAIFPGLILE